MEKVILYANDSMGRYIPKIFAESISLDKCFLFGIEEEDLNILDFGLNYALLNRLEMAYKMIEVLEKIFGLSIEEIKQAQVVKQ